MLVGERDLTREIVRWLYKTARSNLWRVPKWYDYEDLVQDGLVIAVKCRNRYGTDLDPPHMMALVKRSFENHITDLARQKSRRKEVVTAQFLRDDEKATAVSDMLTVTGDQELFALISRTPAFIAEMLRDLTTSNGQRLLQQPYRVRLSGAVETRMERLAKWLGVASDCDAETAYRVYLGLSAT